jgi:hypothetical protein
LLFLTYVKRLFERWPRSAKPQLGGPISKGYEADMPRVVTVSRLAQGV